MACSFIAIRLQECFLYVHAASLFHQCEMSLLRRDLYCKMYCETSGRGALVFQSHTSLLTLEKHVVYVVLMTDIIAQASSHA